MRHVRRVTRREDRLRVVELVHPVPISGQLGGVEKRINCAKAIDLGRVQRVERHCQRARRRGLRAERRVDHGRNRKLRILPSLCAGGRGRGDAEKCPVVEAQRRIHLNARRQVRERHGILQWLQARLLGRVGALGVDLAELTLAEGEVGHADQALGEQVWRPVALAQRRHSRPRAHQALRRGPGPPPALRLNVRLWFVCKP